MQLKVKLTFNDREREAITYFCQQIGMPVPEFCKRAVFYSIRDSYRRAEESNHKRAEAAQDPQLPLETEEIVNALYHASGGIDQADTGAGLQSRSDADTSALADPEATSDTNK